MLKKFPDEQYVFTHSFQAFHIPEIIISKKKPNEWKICMLMLFWYIKVKEIDVKYIIISQ